MKKDEETQSRREFFKKATKKVLPIVGLLATSNMIFAQDTIKTKQTGCKDSSCSSTCVGTCFEECKGRCWETCMGACKGTCLSSCYEDLCGNMCKGYCIHWCTNTCKNSSKQINRADTIIPQKTDSIIH